MLDHDAHGVLEHAAHLRPAALQVVHTRAQHPGLIPEVVVGELQLQALHHEQDVLDGEVGLARLVGVGDQVTLTDGGYGSGHAVLG